MGAVARLSGLIILSKPFDHQLGLLYHILLVFEPHEAGGLVYGDPPALVDLIVVVLDPAGCVFHEEEIDYLEDPFRALHVLLKIPPPADICRSATTPSPHQSSAVPLQPAQTLSLHAFRDGLN